MAPIKTTTSEAIDHVKTWISNNEFEKAQQGLNEILEFEPANADAKKILDEVKAKMEQKKLAAVAAAAPIAAAPITAPTTVSAPISALKSTPVAAIPRIHRKISPIAIGIVAFVLIASGIAGYFGSQYLKNSETPQTPSEETLKGSAVTAPEQNTVNNEITAPEQKTNEVVAPEQNTADSELKGSLMQPEQTPEQPQRIKVKRR